MVHHIGDVYWTLGALVVLGAVSRVLLRSQMKSQSVPDDLKKRFEKFQKNENLSFSMVFHDFA